MNKLKLIQNFLRYLSQKGISPKSLKFYKSDIASFLAWAKNEKINKNLIKRYIESQKLITPPATINRRLSTLRSFANFIQSDFMNGIENVGFAQATSQKFQVTRNAPYRGFQEWILLKTSDLRLQTFFSKLFFSRPNWYKRYHSYPLANYIHLAILVLFMSISGYGLYDQVIKTSSQTFAFPSALTRPNRYLSFQGRLTDNLGNPTTTATNMVFKLYDASTAGSELWTSGTCSITPDQDGIFSIILGSGCGTEITSTVFSENAGVWLGVTVGADAEATPRIQIATVAYALNSETLQGFPAGTGVSTIPYIDSTGKLAIAAASPTLESTSGTFAVKGQALTISTADTTNGSITINPDGTGTLDLTFEGPAAGGGANGFVNATNANITSGSLYSGTVASNATGYNFINFLSGASPTSKFSIDSTGLTNVGADLYVTSGISTFGTAVSDGTVEATKFCTGDGETNCVTDFSSLGSGGSLFTDGGDVTYLTSTTDDFAIGGSTLAASMFGIDESLGNFYFGYDNSANPTFNFEATDGDAGEFGFNTNDSFYFSNANVGIGITNPTQKLAVSGDTYSSGTIAAGMTPLGSGHVMAQNSIYANTGSFVFGSSVSEGEYFKRSGNDIQILAGGGTIAHIDGDTTNFGIGTTGPDAKLDSLATSGEQLRLTYTDGSVYSGFTTDSSGYLIIDPTGARIALDGALQVGGTSPLAYSRLGTATTGHAGNISASNDLLISGDFEVDGTFFLDGGTISNSAGTASIVLSSSVTDTANTLSASNWLVENTANVGQAALMINNTKSGDLLTASASGTPRFTIQNDGDVVLTNGQLRLGNLSSAPTAEGAGSMFFNTTTNTNQCYNGTNWYNCGGTLYSNSNASVADGSYITVTHNLATNDLLSSAWINAQGVWKSLESSYQPAIAWEGKDTQKGVYHNSVNEYTSSSETSLTSTALNTGLLYDTFEDSIKTDSANTTVSVSTDIGDDGSANLATLNQRIQSGRVGLMGGQTLDSTTTDNDGQTYLGSNTVNDIYYYDRSKDSTPEVLVELGIDPNWYNGVTLSVATGSAQYSQNGTIADKNPNLTTNYNGSLIKVTGTDTEPRTIYITIKSPTTFDWTNYQGDSATGVTITPGTAQSLGATGVSVTFTGGVNYNVGDVFKIASWYIEPESATRGAKQQFPERANIVAEGTSSVSIIDADTQKLWMRFTSGASNLIASTYTISAVQLLNGRLYIAQQINVAGGGQLRYADFSSDSGAAYTTTQYIAYAGNISQRDSSLGFGHIINTTQLLVAQNANDVAAAVIPNQPTQEVTVSGWGYIVGDATISVGENVNLPYNFNNPPKITTAQAGYSNTTAPNTLADCSSGIYTSTRSRSFTNNSFSLIVDSTDGSVLSSTRYFCYTWTATGTISPKQFVAVATDGGVTMINETDPQAVDFYYDSDNDVVTKVALSSRGDLYYNRQWNSSSTEPLLQTYFGAAGATTDKTTVNSKHYAYHWNSTPAINTASTDDVTSISISEGTSTVDPGNGNTIYVGTNLGARVIQEKRSYANIQDAGEISQSSVKYYTKDYISEEMIGDIRGMWPLNANNTASDLEDVSVKANALTATNIDSTDAVSGVRGTATDFDGSTEYLSRTDDTDLDFTASDNFTFGTWIKTTSTTISTILAKKNHRGATATGYILSMLSSGAAECRASDGTNQAEATGSVINDGVWHHVLCVKEGTSTIKLYVDGTLVSSSSTSAVTSTLANAENSTVANASGLGLYFTGSIDEAFVTATALTASQIKNMYQVGYRALQSHGTGLGGGGADTNQQLGGTTNTIGVVTPDYNNQFMYVGSNDSTGPGTLSKIQLNSDSNIKTYDVSATGNTPTGGSNLIDDDVTSLAVGETLYAVGSAASGVKSMGVDDNSTATSGNFVSKTYTLPKNIGSAVLWVSPVTDSSDVSNTITVKASNDGGSTYATCTLVNTNSNPAVPEKEYACTFSTADNDLKIKFEFARGSTKTNTYVVQYGISWLGETGFRVEQADTNNVRLYNFSGETQNLKLNVTGASTAALANPWTDAGSYLYPTGYESLRIYDGAGTNYLGLSHDGTLANLAYNGTTILSINSNGDLLPNTDDTQSLGSTTKRWKDLFLGPDSLHIGTSTADEGIISYDTTNNIFQFDTDSTTNADIAFFTDDLYLDKSTGNVGIGTTEPNQKLHIAGNVNLRQTNANTPATLYIQGTGDGNAAYAMLKDTDSNITWYLENRANSSNAFWLENYDGTNWTHPLVVEDSTPSNSLYLDSTGSIGIGTTTPAGTLDIKPVSGNAQIYLRPQTSGANSALEIGTGGSGNRNSYIDFVGDDTYTDYGLRLIRWNGPNANSVLQANGTGAIVIQQTSGGVQLTSGATSWSSFSDITLKNVIGGFSNALDKIGQLNPVYFTWKDDETDKTQVGLIAQDVEKVLPEAVTYSDGLLGVKYTELIPLLTAGIKELNGKFNELRESLASKIVQTNIISPIADSDLIIDLSASESAKLAIKGKDNQEVASIDADGTVNSERLRVNRDATISGTLYADNIESKRLQDIEDLLKQVEENQTLLAETSNWSTDTATESGNLVNSEQLTVNNLYVTEQAAVSSLFVSDYLTTKTINSLDTPLQIQSLAASPLEIMAGKILIDTNGNTKFLGNVEIAGNLTINNLVVATNNIDPIATESAQIVEGEINSNSTAGKAILSANTEKVRINNNKVSLNTLIYITPITSTQNKVLFVKEKGEGYFDIGFSDHLDTDVEFNWWIIELQSTEATSLQQ